MGRECYPWFHPTNTAILALEAILACGISESEIHWGHLWMLGAVRFSEKRFKAKARTCRSLGLRGSFGGWDPVASVKRRITQKPVLFVLAFFCQTETRKEVMALD